MLRIKFILNIFRCIPSTNHRTSRFFEIPYAFMDYMSTESTHMASTGINVVNPCGSDTFLVRHRIAEQDFTGSRF